MLDAASGEIIEVVRPVYKKFVVKKEKGRILVLPASMGEEREKRPKSRKSNPIMAFFCLLLSLGLVSWWLIAKKKRQKVKVKHPS